MNILIFMIFMTCFCPNLNAAACSSDHIEAHEIPLSSMHPLPCKGADVKLHKDIMLQAKYGPTTAIYVDCYGLIAVKSNVEEPLDKESVMYNINTWIKNTQVNFAYPGKVSQIVSHNESRVFIIQNSDGHVRKGPGCKEIEFNEQNTLGGPIDCLHMSPAWDWAVTLNNGKSINLHRCAYHTNFVDGITKENIPDAISAQLLKKFCSAEYESETEELELTEDDEVWCSSLNLFTKPADEHEPLICSFAFSDASEELALVFPHQVMLWRLQANDSQKTLDAKGQIIARANLAADQPLAQLHCFNAAVFSPSQKNNRSLYIVGNNIVWRYTLADRTLEPFRYSSALGLSSPETIAISQDGERLAVANPCAGVTVFDTENMDLLCTILQGSLCKHIALYRSNSDTRLGTSILNENNSSREALWFIDSPNTHTSLLKRCLNALECA